MAKNRTDRPMDDDELSRKNEEDIAGRGEDVDDEDSADVDEVEEEDEEDLEA
jgi:hypothetical protein